MKKVIALLFIFYSISLTAQLTGYMGKRFSLGYTNLFSPKIGRAYGYESGLEMKGFNASHILDLNYIVHYRKAMCFSFSYLESKISNGIVGRDNLRYYNFSDAEHNAKSSSLGFSLGIKLFKRSFLAPLGPYVRWDALLLLNTIKYKSYTYRYPHYNYYNNTNTTELQSFSGGELKSTAFGLAFGFGRQRVFDDKILVDIGLRGAIVISKNNDFNKMYSNYDNALNSLAFDRVFMQQFINLRLGIGFLAF